ncbi:MAG: leucyl-tRNA synthetase [Candidatus Berkelbacteria bacterium Licking1014_7]|uniref:Leucine--tRNA ligase n=1 Tax=Candidatus Berkelbacteria bacterium Licking1014_7 TaxID=2017147 RepID=A0A554LHZ9_9BACT|nr:MAG: leucyl-tRNA synthetase [Candidatus Berkelbacteria bacterium Licking1014_7]
MKQYNHQQIERKWQKIWSQKKVFKTADFSSKKKFYCLDMFPYPSGEGLHVGHPRGYTATDIVARYQRLKGYEVMHPMGWDGFGLPAENYAIKHKIHPAITTKKNIVRIKNQLLSLGYSYDWDREINTTDPQYYKWTQWIFLKLFQRGLAYEARVPINWCPFCQTGLANEEVIQGKCDRCKTLVEKKKIRQWMLKITEYADRLLEDLDDLDWPEAIKTMQKNWIGRSEGVLIKFEIRNLKSEKNPKKNFIEVFTTRPDTLFGCTYLAIAPEKWQGIISNFKVQKYIQEAEKRCLTDNYKKEKTGVFTGVYAINPVNNKKIPIWLTDYVDANYGAGAIMAVPAHDHRDWEFAKKYNLPIKKIVKPSNLSKSVVLGISVKSGFKKELTKKSINFEVGLSRNGREHIRVTLDNSQIKFFLEIVSKYLKDNWWVEIIGSQDIMFFRENGKDDIIEDFLGKEKEIMPRCQRMEELVRNDKNLWEMLESNLFYQGFACYEENGIMLNSSIYSGMDNVLAGQKIVADLEKKDLAKSSTQYKLRDWVFSRQRYWGEPMPLVFCEKCKKQAEKSKIKNQKSKVQTRTFNLGEILNPGWVAVPEKDLPVKLPEVKNYEPTGTGESPLAQIKDWVNVICPKCGSQAKREINTMPQWAGSCWYYVAYLMRQSQIFPNSLPARSCLAEAGGRETGQANLPELASRNGTGKSQNKKYKLDKEAFDHWLPIDLYVGGAEHAVLHLLYARFWHKVLFDEGILSCKEPFQKLINVGTILADDGQKMSKSRGNVINPDDLIEKFGADSLRLYEMFIGPFTQKATWDKQGIVGVYRFLQKVSRLDNLISEKTSGRVEDQLQKTIQKVESDIENFNFNTAISALMIFVNYVFSCKTITYQQLKNFLIILFPFAPHLASEIWQSLGAKNLIDFDKFPRSQKIECLKKITIPVQINGKVRGEIQVEKNASQQQVIEKAQKIATISQYLQGKKIIRIIYVPCKIISFVV